MFNFRIYTKLIRLSFKSRLQYRGDFLTGIVSVILFNTVNLSLIGILVNRFVNLNGWGVWELVFLYSLYMMGHSIFSLFFYHLITLEEYVVQGTFDQFLLKPVSPMIQFLGREIQYMGIGDVVFGICGLSISYVKLGLNWELNSWFFFILVIASGTLIEMAITWIIASISFWTGRSSAGFSVLLRINSLVQQYPIDIFGNWFKLLVTGFIPMAFVNYYPSLYLLGKESGVITFISPLVALTLLLIAIYIWKKALIRYTSSGS